MSETSQPQQNGPRSDGQQAMPRRALPSPPTLTEPVAYSAPRVSAPQLELRETEQRDQQERVASAESCHPVTVTLPWDEVVALRELAAKARAEAFFVSTPRLKDSVQMAPLLNGLDLKSMQRVAQLPLPEGSRWGGSSSAEKRSINRFLNGVIHVQRLAGLDARATFFYLSTRCVDEKLGVELASQCPSLEILPVDYTAVLAEAEQYLRTRFARTNRTDRFSERVESNEWAKDVACLEDYMQSFQFLMREGSLLGISYDMQQRRRIYINGLPAELKKRSYDLTTWMRDAPIEVIQDRLEEWAEISGINHFAKKKVVIPAGARMVERKHMEEVDDDTTHFSSCAAVGEMRSSEGVKCFQCGGNHFRRDCSIWKELQAAKSSKGARKAVGADRKAESGVQDQHESGSQELSGACGTATEKRVKWGCTIVAAAASASSAVSGEVLISSPNGDNCNRLTLALFDTGADVSMATRKFVDQLFDQGIVKQANAIPGKGPELLLADGTPMMKPLGTIEVCVEGHKTNLVVVDNLCCDLIVGKDLIKSTRSDVFVLKLVMALRGCSVSEAKKLCAAATVAPVNLHSADEQETPKNLMTIPKKSHCDFEPIVFNWKEGAKESLKCNIKAAVAEARQKEKRMDPKLLESYNAILEMWEREGWLAEVPLRDAKFFLRHFAVVRDPNGATPMKRCRVVVEGSALTDLLEVPPCSHTDLVKNLLMWRTANRFSCLDISQAYMRVRISSQDSLYMCIAWKDRALAFRSLPMGVSPSAQALQAIVDKYIENWESLEAKKELNSAGCSVKVAPYMDDLTLLIWRREPSEGEGEVEVDLGKIEGDLSDKLAAFFTAKGLDIAREKSVSSYGCGTLLGVPFRNGALGVEIGRLKAVTMEEFGHERPTRRRACSLLAAVFDPLGIVAELGMGARILASKFSGLAWNALLPAPLATDLRRWVELAKRATNVAQPRLLVPGVENRVFVFSDASAVGYAVVVVSPDENGIQRRFMAKGRLYQKHQKPWVGNSPKIELLGLKLAVETIVYLRKVFEGIPCWDKAVFVVGTDSEANFQRLAQGDEALLVIEDRWQRITAIEVCNLLAKHGCLLYHVPGALNPADSVSRGVWQGDSLSMMEAAVKWFDPERAAKPKRYLGSVDAPLMDDSCGKLDCPNDSESLKAAAIRERSSPAFRFSPIETLAERFVREAGGLSRQEWFLKHQTEDPDIKQLIKGGHARMQNGVWVHVFRQELDGTPLYPVIVPPQLRQNVMKDMHGQGHLGVRKTIAKTRDFFWWKGMARDLKRFCLHCTVCQELKGRQVWKTASGDPGLLRVDGGSWSVVGVDTVKAPNAILLTATCLYSRFAFATVVKDERAATLAKAVEKWFLQEGAPAVLATDNGTYFRSSEFQSMLAKWGVTARFSPRYSPWVGGFFEISHKTLMTVLAALTLEAETMNWKSNLQEAVLFYNMRCYEGSGEMFLCPFEVFRGRKLRNPWNTTAETVDVAWPADDAVREAAIQIDSERKRIGQMYEDVWKQMRANSMAEMTRKSGKKETFRKGEYVYVWLPPETRNGKLAPKWEGPFRVDKVLSNSRYQIGDREEHSLNLKRAYLMSDDQIERANERYAQEANDPGVPTFELNREENLGGQTVEEIAVGLPNSDNQGNQEHETSQEILETNEEAIEQRDSDRQDIQMNEQEQAEIERTERRDKRRSDQIESENSSGVGEVRRVQPPRAAKLKKQRLAVVLMHRPKGDLLWL